MLPTGIVLLVIGLAAAIASFFWKRSSQKSSGWWSTVQDVDIATALKQPARTAVAVSGTSVAPQTEAGDVLKDPVHDQACCWWRETVTEHWEERVRDYSDDKNDSRPDYRWEQRSNQVSERVSGLPFTLQDGATIKVDLEGIDVDGDLLTEDTRQQRQGSGESIAEALIDGLLSTSGGRRDAYIETKIEVLPAGKQMLVSGRTSGDRIVADEDFGLKICEGTVAGQLGDSRKSEKRAHVALLAGSGLTVLGVVLAAAGAASA